MDVRLGAPAKPEESDGETGPANAAGGETLEFGARGPQLAFCFGGLVDGIVVKDQEAGGGGSDADCGLLVRSLR